MSYKPVGTYQLEFKDGRGSWSYNLRTFVGPDGRVYWAPDPKENIRIPLYRGKGRESKPVTTADVDKWDVALMLEQAREIQIKARPVPLEDLAKLYDESVKRILADLRGEFYEIQ
ncbi:hypothetical protein HYX04_00895 [Candidatus Woesearchaeota archaeon]|nr:hypothetical protein [Candidatus Woesearchaeota archaeon]